MIHGLLNVHQLAYYVAISYNNVLMSLLGWNQ